MNFLFQVRRLEALVPKNHFVRKVVRSGHICMYVYKYSVDIYFMCMIKVRIGGVLVVCEECYNLG